jgi:hypothetical protein
MAYLMTEVELARWTQTDEATVAADVFAQEVLEKVSALVREIAEQPTWEIGGTNPIPYVARMKVIEICRRTYANPGQVVSSTTGPISERVLDMAALATSLTPDEVALFRTYVPDGSGDQGLWTFSLAGPGNPELRTVYIADSDQPGLGDGIPWAIPYGDTRETDFFTEPGDTYA